MFSIFYFFHLPFAFVLLDLAGKNLQQINFPFIS